MKRPKVAIVGTFQDGKSTLLNCLLDGRYAATGEGISTTKVLAHYRFGEHEEVVLVPESGKHRYLDSREELLSPDFSSVGLARIEVTCWKPLLEKIDLVDTPGVNANSRDTAVAHAGIDEADLLILLVRNRGLDDYAQSLLARIHAAGKRCVIVVNCHGARHELAEPRHEDNGKIVASIKAAATARGYAPLEVIPCNLLWAWHGLGHLRRDGKAFDAESKLDTVANHFRRHPVGPREILEASQLSKIRSFLRDYDWAPSHRLASEGSVLMERVENNWKHALEQALEK